MDDPVAGKTPGGSSGEQEITINDEEGDAVPIGAAEE